jgi:hypothetical protein
MKLVETHPDTDLVVSCIPSIGFVALHAPNLCFFMAGSISTNFSNTFRIVKGVRWIAIIFLMGIIESSVYACVFYTLGSYAEMLSGWNSRRVIAARDHSKVERPPSWRSMLL